MTQERGVTKVIGENVHLFPPASTQRHRVVRTLGSSANVAAAERQQDDRLDVGTKLATPYVDVAFAMLVIRNMRMDMCEGANASSSCPRCRLRRGL